MDFLGDYISALSKFWRAKKVQNSARFLTTFDFDGEYLRNDSRYPKRKEMWSTAIPSTFHRERSVNLGPQTKKLILANIDPLKWTFRGRLYFGP